MTSAYATAARGHFIKPHRRVAREQDESSDGSHPRGRRCFCPVRKHCFLATASHCSVKWRFCVVVVHRVTTWQKEAHSWLTFQKWSRGLTVLFSVRACAAKVSQRAEAWQTESSDTPKTPPRFPRAVTKLGSRRLAPLRAAAELNLSATSVVFAANR